MSEDRGRRRFETELADLLGEVVASDTGLTDIDLRQLGVPARWHRRLLAASKEVTSKLNADETAQRFADEIFNAVDAGESGSPGKHRAASLLAERVRGTDSRVVSMYERALDNETATAERQAKRDARLGGMSEPPPKPAPARREATETAEQREARIISRIQNRE